MGEWLSPADRSIISVPIQKAPENGNGTGITRINTRLIVAEIKGLNVHPAGDDGPHSPREIASELLGFGTF